jgi:arylsulfatase A-like enzyme
MRASAIALLTVLVSAACCCAAESAAFRPNILIIVADDMGFSDAGCYGGEIATPNLDALAAGGIRFTQFYNTARCWPTRSSLMTGYYAQQIRADPPQGHLPSWARTLPHLLKPLGYRCYHSGKWHVPGAPKPVADGGFDRSYWSEDYDRNFSPAKHFLDDQPLPKVEAGSGYYATTAMAGRTIEFLKQHAEEHAGTPFFAYLAFFAPHFPLHALPEDIERYRDRYLEGWDAVRERRWNRQREMGIVNCALPPLEEGLRTNVKQATLDALGPGELDHAVPWSTLTEVQQRFQATKMAIHAAMVDRIDREIGRVLDQVKAMGAWEDTVIFFLSDNGASAELLVRGDGHDPAAPPGSARSFLCLGPGWASAANTPFRRHKMWAHEGGIATPLIVHWPKGISARGELRRDAGHVIDLLPTLLDLAGGRADVPASAPALPGRSLVPAFAKNAAAGRDYLFFHHQGNRALRMGNWKIVASARDGDAWALYDLGADRCEQVNLAPQDPDRVKAMSERWGELESLFRRQAGAESKADAEVARSRNAEQREGPPPPLR